MNISRFFFLFGSRFGDPNLNNVFFSSALFVPVFNVGGGWNGGSSWPAERKGLKSLTLEGLRSWTRAGLGRRRNE